MSRLLTVLRRIAQQVSASEAGLQAAGQEVFTEATVLAVNQDGTVLLKIHGHGQAQATRLTDEPLSEYDKVYASETTEGWIVVGAVRS